MKAICHREGLLAACQLASAAISSRDMKPILRNIKAIAEDGRCTLMATDLELGIRLDVQGLTIQEPGEAILLPSARARRSGSRPFATSSRVHCSTGLTSS